MRVLKEGMVSPDEALVLVEKAPHSITVHEVNEVKYRQVDQNRLKAVLEVDALADVVRKSLEKRVQPIEKAVHLLWMYGFSTFKSSFSFAQEDLQGNKF